MNVRLLYILLVTATLILIGVSTASFTRREHFYEMPPPTPIIQQEAMPAPTAVIPQPTKVIPAPTPVIPPPTRLDQPAAPAALPQPSAPLVSQETPPLPPAAPPLVIPQNLLQSAAARTDAAPPDPAAIPYMAGPYEVTQKQDSQNKPIIVVSNSSTQQRIASLNPGETLTPDRLALLLNNVLADQKQQQKQ